MFRRRFGSILRQTNAYGDFSTLTPDRCPTGRFGECEFLNRPTIAQSLFLLWLAFVSVSASELSSDKNGVFFG